MFKGPDTDINLHVLSSGCPEIDRILMFQHRLRGHPSDLDLYARTKLALAQREWEFVQYYADAKSDVIAEILARCQPDPWHHSTSNLFSSKWVTSTQWR